MLLLVSFHFCMSIYSNPDEQHTDVLDIIPFPADAAEKAAAKARPDEDALRRADEPAPENQWIAPDGSSECLHIAFLTCSTTF